MERVRIAGDVTDPDLQQCTRIKNLAKMIADFLDLPESEPDQVKEEPNSPGQEEEEPRNKEFHKDEESSPPKNAEASREDGTPKGGGSYKGGGHSGKKGGRKGKKK